VGSGTGIASLINRFADIANASRKMTDKETELAKKHGYDPQEFIVGYDALAIFCIQIIRYPLSAFPNWQKSSAKQEKLLNGANSMFMFPVARNRR
jgi:hypothetical protein